MAPATIPTTDPKILRAGDTWRWDRTEADYSPADGWSLTYEFRGADTLTVAGVANAANSGWELTATAAETAPLAAGDYAWVVFVTSGAERYTLRSGSLHVLPNVSTASPGELQPSAEILLPLVKAEIRARITGTGAGHNQYMIGDRSIDKFSLEELRKLERELKQELQLGRNGGRLKPYAVRFSRV